jgi:hypothetical protein
MIRKGKCFSEDNVIASCWRGSAPSKLKMQQRKWCELARKRRCRSQIEDFQKWKVRVGKSSEVGDQVKKEDSVSLKGSPAEVEKCRQGGSESGIGPSREEFWGNVREVTACF